jgi:hypothetical protein
VDGRDRADPVRPLLVSVHWFAAAPSAQELARVSLDFGLRRADRALRELIVPEMGRIWFVRQLSWPVAALALRDALRGKLSVKASTISHGLEALGCKLEWANGDGGDRILGTRAFGRDGDDMWCFKELCDGRHYVRNTHRQAATRALRVEGGIGLATGERFDVLELTAIGRELADAFLDQSAGKGGGRLRNLLLAWVRDGEPAAVSPTWRRALGPSRPTEKECAIVRARVFGAATPACETRQRAASAMGQAVEMREMRDDIAPRLRTKGYVQQANDILAAHSFGAMMDRARDLASVLSARVEDTRMGLAVTEIPKDKQLQQAANGLQDAASSFRERASAAKFTEARSRGFALALEGAAIAEVVQAVARAASQIFSVADDRVMRGPLFRRVESSEAIRDVEPEDGADAIEPDRTSQTFRLANLHALVRDLAGGPST